MRSDDEVLSTVPEEDEEDESKFDAPFDEDEDAIISLSERFQNLKL